LLEKIKHYIQVHATAGLSSTVCEKVKRKLEDYSCKDQNRTIITDTTEKANIFNSYYASTFCYNRKIPEIKLANSDETLIINIQVIRKILGISGEKSVMPDRFPCKILHLGWEAITPSRARLLEISLNNATIPRNWKIATVVHIYNGVIDRHSQTIDP